MTLTFVFVSIVLILVLSNRSKLMLYSMNYKYFKMLEDKMPLIELDNKIFTPSWMEFIKSEGFMKSSENNQFMVYFKVDKKIKDYVAAGETLVCIVIAKTFTHDFYSENVDAAISRIYSEYPNSKRIHNQIVLQFNKYASHTSKIQDDLEEVIMFKERNNYIVNLPVGYFVKENSAYFLRPEKVYPNKAYYYAVKLAHKFLFMTSKGDETNE